jgi:periplasmic divalent cation tolerance protein
MQPILILWTCKDSEEGKQIAKALLEQRLIACASIIPSVESFFHWQGKIEHAQESKVFLKTVRQHFFAVRDYILTHSSYEIPEILELRIEQGNPAYLAWLQNEVKR